MLVRLATLIWRRPRSVLAAGALVFAACVVLGGDVANRLAAAGFDDPDSESAVVGRELQRELGYDVDPGLVLRADPGGRGPDVAEAELARLSEVARADQHVTRVAPLPPPPRTDARYLVVNFADDNPDRVVDAVERLEPRLESEVVDIRVGGFGKAFTDVSETVEDDLRRAETIAFPLLAILLVLVFRGLIAALLPLTLAAFALFGTFAGLRVLDEAVDISVFALNLSAALGLALAVDYSLFVVSRYREEMEKRGHGLEALQTTLRTAGHTVAFSGVTVAAAMGALILFPQRFLYSIGAGGIFVATFAALAALTVIPAMLALLGPRVNALSIRRRARPPEERDLWMRAPRWVARHAPAVSVLVVVALVALSSPSLRAEFTTFEPAILPPQAEARIVSEATGRDYAPGQESPIVVLADGGPATPAALERLRARLASLEGAAAVTQPRPLGPDSGVMEVVPAQRPIGDEAVALVERLRGLDGQFRLRVSGQTAEFVDLKESVGSTLPLALGLIAITTFLLLFAMTGSVVLPVKSLILDGLTLAATFGALVLVFQDARLEGLLDYESQGAIELSQSVLLLAIVFGLATDYTVFLLGRMKELRDAGDPEPVSRGVHRTGPLITAAAVLLCVAIGAFATSHLVFMKENGLGIAFAVLLDATIVRVLLIPAFMALLGERAWWAPRPLLAIRARVMAAAGSRA